MSKKDHARRQGPLLPIIHGTTALFLGIGMARFSFSPVIPLLVRDEWYSASQAQMLGAWGLAGYLLGCFIAQRLARLVPINLLTGLLATSIVISFWVCSYPVAYPIAAFWRLISGVAGAAMMIICVSDATARLTAIGHGDKAGYLFAGVGAGAVIAAVFMPFLAEQDVAVVSWLLTGLSLFALILQLTSASLMQHAQAPSKAPPQSRVEAGRETAIFWVLAAYGLDAIGLTPVAVYFVDYAAREVGMPFSWASTAWAGFGIGAICGPLVMIRLGNGWLPASFALKTLALVLIAATTSPLAYVFAAFICGFFTPGLAIQVAGFIRQAVAGKPAFMLYWAWATTIFAVAQAAIGFVASGVSHAFGSYRPVFWACAIALLLGVLCTLIGGRRLRRAEKS